MSRPREYAIRHVGDRPEETPYFLRTRLLSHVSHLRTYVPRSGVTTAIIRVRIKATVPFLPLAKIPLPFLHLLFRLTTIRHSLGPTNNLLSIGFYRRPKYTVAEASRSSEAQRWAGRT